MHWLIKLPYVLNSSQIRQILESTAEPCIGEDKLASLTANNRSLWAQVRNDYFFKDVNKTSLELIERAAFIVVLDDIPYEFDKVRYVHIFYIKVILTRFMVFHLDSFIQKNSTILVARCCMVTDVTGGSINRSIYALAVTAG